MAEQKPKSMIEIIKEAGYVMVVRCKDCRKRYTPMCQLYFGCPKQKDSFFCADGEPK